MPATVGVRVMADQGLGKINSSGMQVSGATYTNAAYGQTDHTLNIEMNAGIGNITIEAIK